MDKIKNVPIKVKNFVVRHKVGVAIAGTAVAGLVWTRLAVRQHDEFLAEKGLLDEFYSPED